MRIGSLFSGYGGLCELSVAPLLNATVAWHSEIDPDASCILAHHWPGVPNLGDITKVDWKTVEPVDVLTGGFPCQDVSHAGKRLGLHPDTRSGLWSQMAYAVSILRPSLVVVENVRGLLSAPAHGDLEPCAWCVGDGEGSPLRALGAVLGDLAGLGYDTRWAGIRAADAGAPHGRFRVFLVAQPADADNGGRIGVVSGSRQEPGTTSRRATPPERRQLGSEDHSGLLPTPRTSDTNGAGHGDGGLDLRTAVNLLPTPTAMDAAGARNSTAWCSNPDKPVNIGDTLTDFAWKYEGHVNPRIEAQRLLQTPSVADALGGHLTRSGIRSEEPLLPGQAKAMHGQDWGTYADAISRWEHLTRPAPPPTQPSTKGTPQLSPRFSEWLMGLPEGHVTTAVPGLSRNAQLKALGNGVVPQQAALALRLLLADALAVAA